MSAASQDPGSMRTLHQIIGAWRLRPPGRAQVTLVLEHVARWQDSHGNGDLARWLRQLVVDIVAGKVDVATAADAVLLMVGEPDP